MISELVKEFTLGLEIEEDGQWIVSPMLIQGDLTEDQLLEIAFGFDFGVLIELRGDEISDEPADISMAGRWCDCISDADFISLKHCNQKNL